MDIEGITVAALKQTLRACRQGDKIPDDLLSLDLLRPYHPTSASERRHHLNQHLYQLVESQLSQQRRAVNLLCSPANDKTSLLQQITADFSHSYPPLEAWSALYHRYLTAVQIDVAALVAALPGEDAANEKLFQRRLNSGLNLLRDCLQQEEMAAHGRYQQYHRGRHLPPPDYAKLFGVDPLIKQLTHWLNDPQQSPFISIEGMGGIGKTAVARATANQQTNHTHWHDILWISARQYSLNLESGQMQSTLTAARTFADITRELSEQLGHSHLAGLAPTDKLHRLLPALKAAPHLIIIDNLETLTDVESLLPELQPLATPSRFLFTSRHTMSRFPFVQCLPIPALSWQDSYALLQSELGRRRISDLPRHTMDQIYDVIGGLPLALKLLAAQLGKFPLADLLQRLDHASPNNIYSYIYRLTWQQLQRPARRLLTQLLDIPPDGADLACLKDLLVLSDEELTQGLTQLIDFSLVEVAGNLHNPIYKLHRLTATFLQAEIIDGWDGE